MAFGNTDFPVLSSPNLQIWTPPLTNYCFYLDIVLNLNEGELTGICMPCFKTYASVLNQSGPVSHHRTG